MKKVADTAPGKKATTKTAPPMTPDEKYRASRYMIDEKTHGFPAAAVKKAMISVVRMLGTAGQTNLSMVAAKPMFVVSPTKHHALMELRFKSVRSAEDIATIPKTHAPIPVYRAVYSEWECDCIVTFDEELISAEAIFGLLAKAGQVGIGAWRPECNGSYGTFTVKTTETKRRRKAG